MVSIYKKSSMSYKLQMVILSVLSKFCILHYNNERIQKFLGYLTPIQYKEKELERIKKEKVLQK